MTDNIRISLVLAREDNPRLYDELVQFPKGQRRVNRLRMLAYDGLLAQSVRGGQPVVPVRGEARHAAEPEASADRVEASLELFSRPFLE
ncbi:MAG TPA: hypothetical protein VF774_21510 [Pseudoduganella sp.]|jgi:hypothetical protein